MHEKERIVDYGTSYWGIVVMRLLRQWVTTYKEGAIREVTMGKYRLTQAWLSGWFPIYR